MHVNGTKNTVFVFRTCHWKLFDGYVIYCILILTFLSYNLNSTIVCQCLTFVLANCCFRSILQQAERRLLHHWVHLQNEWRKHCAVERLHFCQKWEDQRLQNLCDINLAPLCHQPAQNIAVTLQTVSLMYFKLGAALVTVVLIIWPLLRTNHAQP